MRDDIKVSFYVGGGRDGKFYPIVNTCTPLNPASDGHMIGNGYDTEGEATEAALEWEAKAKWLLGNRLTKHIRYNR